MIVAIIPAAGKSQRFGQNKLACPIGERTVLEHVIGSLRMGGADLVLAVLSPENAPLANLIARTEAVPLVLDQPSLDMRATIEAGLAWVATQLRTPPQAWLVCPADHPAIAPTVVEKLIAAFDVGPTNAIFVPTYNGQRGHPVLLDWQHAERFRQFSRSAGLNQYIREQIVVEVPVDCPGILWDLDTADDLARIQALLSSQIR